MINTQLVSAKYAVKAQCTSNLIRTSGIKGYSRLWVS